MKRASNGRIHAIQSTSLGALRQRCSSRHVGALAAPRRVNRRADIRPVSRRPKRLASRACVCACDVRDTHTRMGARRKRARAHLTFFPWDSGTVGQHRERGEG
jgi:hypothetical protein